MRYSDHLTSAALATAVFAATAASALDVPTAGELRRASRPRRKPPNERKAKPDKKKARKATKASRKKNRGKK